MSSNPVTPLTSLLHVCCPASGAASLCHGDELCGLASSLADGPVPSPSSSGGLQPAQQGPAASEPGSYLHLATQRITQALENEAAGDYMEAFQGYRSGVDLLLQGMQGTYELISGPAHHIEGLE